MLEPGHYGLSRALSEVTDQRRLQWPDASGLDFEMRFLLPLSEVLTEIQRAVEEFEEEFANACAELGEN